MMDIQTLSPGNTSSQAVARIADRTASQHLWGSRDIVGHVIAHMPFPIGGPLEMVSETFNVECNAVVDMTLHIHIRPRNKGHGHSF